MEVMNKFLAQIEVIIPWVILISKIMKLYTLIIYSFLHVKKLKKNFFKAIINTFKYLKEKINIVMREM